MIRTLQDYKRYRSYEKTRHGLKALVLQDPADKFIKWLRRYELTYNSKGILHLLWPLCWLRFRRLSLLTGISIGKNVFDKGLFIPHYGSIVVNSACHVGSNCRLHNNVNIGASGGNRKAPRIGKDVYIGPGAVIFGDIEIADGCYIGANAVVNKSFVEPDSVIVGAPAKVVGTEHTHWWEKNGLNLQ